MEMSIMLRLWTEEWAVNIDGIQRFAVNRMACGGMMLLAAAATMTVMI